MLAIAYPDGLCSCQQTTIQAILDSQSHSRDLPEVQAIVAEIHGEADAQTAIETLMRGGWVERWEATHPAVDDKATRKASKEASKRAGHKVEKVVTRLVKIDSLVLTPLAAETLSVALQENECGDAVRWGVADKSVGGFWEKQGTHPGEWKISRMPRGHRMPSLDDPRLAQALEDLAWPDRAADVAALEYAEILRDRATQEPLKLFGGTIPVDKRLGKARPGKPSKKARRKKSA